YETEHFREIADYITDPVMRQEALYQGLGSAGISGGEGGYQALTGRITRYPGRRREKTPATPHRDITLMHRWMDALGVDIACLFPTPMLARGSCRRGEVEGALSSAYNRWLIERILAADSRIRAMLYLPFNDPAACYRMATGLAGKPGVVGFMVTAPHYRGV